MNDGAATDPEGGDEGVDALELPEALTELARALRHEHIHRTGAYLRVSADALAEPAEFAASASPPAENVEPAVPTAAESASPGEGAPRDRRAGVRPAGPRESVDDVRRRVQRQQASDWTAARKLEYLEAKHIGDCRRCRLCERRQHIVFGVGNPEARLMFVGEGPGAEEDRRGEPFVGPAGRRLDQWIEALGLRREDVYIANVVKCRPPGNRDPRPDEIARCSPFLHAQIRAIEPSVIVALGRFAGAQMLGREQKLYQMRGAVHRYREPKSGREIPVVVTYHPAYVLRREGEEIRDPRRAEAPSDRKSENEKVLDDLRAALAVIERDGS